MKYYQELFPSGGWRQSKLPNSSFVDIVGVACSSFLNCFACGQQGIVSQHSSIFQSKNLGLSWNVIFKVSSVFNELTGKITQGEFTDIALNSVTLTILTCSKSGQIYVSTNNGASWITAASVPAYLYGLSIGSNNVAFAVGQSNTTNAGVVYSSNTDFSVWILRVAVQSSFSSQLNGVFTLDGLFIVAVGKGGLILHSKNAGLSWTRVTTTLCSKSDLYSVSYSPDYAVYAGGDNGCLVKFGINSSIVLVQNRTLFRSLSIKFHAISVVSSQLVYITGVNSGGYSPGLILKSPNGGEDWMIEYSAPNTYFNSIYMLDYQVGIAGAVTDLTGRNNIYVRTPVRTSVPTSMPSGGPSIFPTCQPTKQPLRNPSKQPYRKPTRQPQSQPTYQPQTSKPTSQPTGVVGNGNWLEITNIASIAQPITAYFRSGTWISNNLGVLVGGSTNTGIILNSKDAGKTWKVALLNSAVLYQDVDFVTVSSEVYIVAVDTMGNVSVSIDGGASWPVVSRTSSKPLYSISISKSNGVGWAVGLGDIYRSSYKSTFSTWKLMTIKWSVLYNTPTNLFSVAVLNSTNFVISGSSLFVAICEDYASFIACSQIPYSNIDASLTSTVFGLSCGDHSSILVTTNTGIILRSINGGYNWKALSGISSAPTFQWTNAGGAGFGKVLHMLTQSIAYLVDSKGDIHTTKNGGNSWAIESTVAENRKLPLFIRMYTGGSLGIVGGSVGNIFLKSPSPTSNPTSRPSRGPMHRPTRQPVDHPSAQPIRHPSFQPRLCPSIQPIVRPSLRPSSKPSSQPSILPIHLPSSQPISKPSRQPISIPTRRPSLSPTRYPTLIPTHQKIQSPTTQPIMSPTFQPMKKPTSQPSKQPSSRPLLNPSCQPLRMPSILPSHQPTCIPAVHPTVQPFCHPSGQPTREPYQLPTAQPIKNPTKQPLHRPSSKPSLQPFTKPSLQPSIQPMHFPSIQPRRDPTNQPSHAPTIVPSISPTKMPNQKPTKQPIRNPFSLPTHQPVKNPSYQPQSRPTFQPSKRPSKQPSRQPYSSPSLQPNCNPSTQPLVRPTEYPSHRPTIQPTLQPVHRPSHRPSSQPLKHPSTQPFQIPTTQPVAAHPSRIPSGCPSSQPSQKPYKSPTDQPSNEPSMQPYSLPSFIPSMKPTRRPEKFPSQQPICCPTSQPYQFPSSQPRSYPSHNPSRGPMLKPSQQPSSQPKAKPSHQPSEQPTAQPLHSPSYQPVQKPTANPSSQPIKFPSKQPIQWPSKQPFTNPSHTPSLTPSHSPTTQPFRNPSGEPSKQPYRKPSKQPSRQPYRRPSKFPSRIPTQQPVKDPSCKPTLRPSKQPIRKPSSQPVKVPTSRPSHQRTNKPSSQPQLKPSIQPSKQPSGLPSYQPSSLPSLEPNSIPSIKPSAIPTIIPSMRPTLVPSFQPYVKPSLLPSHQPTRVPSSQPRENPSSRPSIHPTARPTGYPIQAGVKKTPRPSKAPSYTPSMTPTTTYTRWVELFDSISESFENLNTSSVFYQELTVNGVLHTGGCSRFQSFISGDIINKNILQVPVSIRLETVTNIYTSTHYTAVCSSSTAVTAIVSSLSSPTISGSKVFCNGNYWNTKLCGGASFLCINCSDPCSAFGCSQSNPFFLGPCGSSSGSCPSIDSSTHALRIDYRNRYSVPTITDLQLNVSSTSVGITTKLSFNGFIYCAVYTGNEKPTKVSSIFDQNHYALFVSNSTGIQILNLNPSTVYSLYCATKNFYGNQMAFTDVLKSVGTFETSCCRIVSVSLVARYVVVGASVADAVFIKIDKAPLYPIRVLLSAITIGPSSSTYSHRLDPAFIVIADIGTYSASLTTVNTLYPGRCIINATIVNTYDYNVQYVNDISSFTIVGSPRYIPAPVALVAEFSSDGYSISIAFDSPTDTANFQSTIFACSQLLLFKTVQDQRCQWTSPKQLNILLSPLSVLQSGDAVNVLGGRIKSASADTSRFNYTVATNLTLVYPVNINAPVGVLKISPVINICNSFDVDISYSTGAGNRKWKYVTFFVASPNAYGSSAANLLQNFLNTPFDNTRPVAVPYNFLSVGFYNMFVYLCNFMEVCGISSSSFEVTNDVVPVVSIDGSSFKYVKRSDSLIITSSVLSRSCSAISSDSYTFVWDVLKSDVSQSLIQSVSTDPSIFQLDPYTLSANTMYVVVVTVFSTSNPSIISQSTISVTVAQSSIIAVIDGCGSSGVLNVGEALVLNASSSYDEDLPSTGNSSFTNSLNFIYKWSCLTISPSVNSTCAIAIKSDSIHSALLNVYAVRPSINHVVRIVLQVISGSRSASTSVEFKVIPSSGNFIRIQSSPQIAALVSGKVKINGFIKSASDGFSSWSTNDTTVRLESLLLSPINQFWQPSSISPDYVIPVSLVLSANALSPNSFYLFSLSYTDTRGMQMSASVVVNTGGIPRSGSLSVHPLQGVEMTDPFQFTASFWLDVNLPLQYVFSFLHGGSYQALNLAYEKNADQFLLPSGLDSTNMSLPCSVRVINSLGANNSAFKTVQVFRNTQFQTSSYVTNRITTSLNSALLSEDSNAVQYVLATSGAILDVIVCSAAPKCFPLGRYDCSEVSNTCGSCFPGFIGEIGNRNTKCYNSTVYHIQTSSRMLLEVDEPGDASYGIRKLSSSCTTSNDCAVFEICNVATARCVQQSKQCLVNCNGRGTCTYQSTYSGAPLSSCSVSDTQCTARCRCVNSFGSYCAYLSADQLITARNTRFRLISALNNSTKTNSKTLPIISAQLSTLQSLTSVPDELSVDAILVSNTILLSIVNTAQRIAMSYEDLLPVPAVVDNLLQAVITSYSGNPNLVSGIIDAEYAIMEIFTEIAFSDMSYGQNMYQSVFENIRYSIAAVSAYSINNNVYQLSAPQSSIEATIGYQLNAATVINVDSGNTLAMGAVEFVFHGVSFDSSSISSPLLIQLNTICSDGCSLSLELENRGVQKYSTINSTSQQFKAQCTFGVTYKHDYICKSGYTAQVFCNGSFSGTETVLCPSNFTQPICNAMDEQSSKSSICSTSSYSARNTSCTCDLSTISVNTDNIMRFTISSQKSVKHFKGSAHYTPSTGSGSSQSSQTLIESLYSYRYVLGSVGILIVGLFLLGCYGIFYFCLFKATDVSDLQRTLRQLMKENIAHRAVAEVPEHILASHLLRVVNGPALTFLTYSQLQYTINHIKRLQIENELWDEYYDAADATAKAAIIHVPRLRTRLTREPHYLLTEKNNPIVPASPTGNSIKTTGIDTEPRSQKFVNTDSRSDIDRDGLSVSDIYPSFNEQMPNTSFNNEFYLRSVEKIPLTIHIHMDADDSTLSSSNNGMGERPLAFDEPLDSDHDVSAEQKEEPYERQQGEIELKLSLGEDDEMDLELNEYDGEEWPDDDGGDDDLLFALSDFKISESAIKHVDEVEHKDIALPIKFEEGPKATSLSAYVEKIEMPIKPIAIETVTKIDANVSEKHIFRRDQKAERLPELPPEPVPKRSLVLSPQAVRPLRDPNKPKGKQRSTLGDDLVQEPFSGKVTPKTLKGDMPHPWLPTGVDAEQSQPTEFQDWMRLDFNPNAAQAEQPQTATSRYLKPTKSSNSKVIGADTNTTAVDNARTSSSTNNEISNINTDTLISSSTKKPLRNVYKPRNTKSINIT